METVIEGIDSELYVSFPEELMAGYEEVIEVEIYVKKGKCSQKEFKTAKCYACNLPHIGDMIA